MATHAKKKFGKVKPRTQEIIDKVIDRKAKKTRKQIIEDIKNMGPGWTPPGVPKTALTDRGFEELPRSKGGKVMSGNELVASCYDK